MTFDNDYHVDGIADRTRAAQEAFEQALVPARLPAWLRLQSWRRLAHAQRDHVHWWYSRTQTTATCTCGLRADLPAPPVHTVPGHRDPVGQNPTRQLVVPRGPRIRPEREHTWVVVCQACEYTSDPETREIAARTYDRHLSSCPSLRAEREPDQ